MFQNERTKELRSAGEKERGNARTNERVNGGRKKGWADQTNNGGFVTLFFMQVVMWLMPICRRFNKLFPFPCQFRKHHDKD